MLQQLDHLLKKRRKDCFAEKDRVGRYDFSSLAAYRRKLVPQRKELRTMLGWPLVGSVPRGEGKVRVTSCGSQQRIRAWRVRIPALGPLQCYGILLLPEGPPPYRFVISQHGGLGTPEMTADFSPTENYHAMSLRLVRAGYGVFAPQLFLSWRECHGPTRDQLQIDRDLKQVGSSLAALNLLMLERITDWLLAREDNGCVQVGYAGLSYGGLYGMLLGALDPRISAVVSSCFFNDRIRYNESDVVWFNSASRFCDEDLCALIAPRALYIELAKKDALFDSKSARRAVGKVRAIYRKLRLSERFVFHEFDGVHEFNPQSTPIEFLLTHYPPMR